jgi:hypothetical protein
MWTSVSREDRYVQAKGGWIGQGTVYHHYIYDEKFTREFACERGYLIRDLATISATKDLLDHWGVKYRFLAMLPIVNTSELAESKASDNQDVAKLYQPVLDSIAPSVWEVIFKKENWNNKPSDFGPKWGQGVRDPHPDPIEALEYVEQVCPEFSIHETTRSWCRNFKFGDKKFLNKIGRL